jgi:hypothetical protein
MKKNLSKMENQIAIYQSKSGAIELKKDAEKETLWANLQQIANIFETDKSGISRHISNIYSTNELSAKRTVANIATVQIEGVRSVKRNIECYNLDMIISIGYRVTCIQLIHVFDHNSLILYNNSYKYT